MCMMQPVKIDQQLFYATVKVGWHGRSMSLTVNSLRKQKEKDLPG